jgi:GntR family transcriptional regulator
MHGLEHSLGPLRHAPLYRWLAETLRDDISQGVYGPGDILPPEHELMRRYDLSSTTVRRAVHELVREGWIYRKAGKGTFVRRTRVEEHLSRLTSFMEEMRSRNIAPSFKLVCAKPCAPSAEAARALNLSGDQEAFYIERVQLGNGEPIALAQGYWRREIGEQLAQHDFNLIGLYEVLESTLRIPLVEADESISAAVADADIARKLDIPRRTPLLVRRRLSYTTAMRPVEYTTTFYRADRYEYKIRLAREGV